MRGGNNNRGGGGRSRGGGGGGRNRGGGGGGGPRTSNLPLEQGVVCSLKESFGFIHCADRPEEIFFHYSSVTSPHPDDLNIDDEVEFRVGSSSRDPDKLAAYEVKRLPADVKIAWEVEDKEGERYQGIVEKTVREDRRSGNSMPGSIRILVPKESEEENEEGTNGDDKPTVLSAAEGPLIRFTARDYSNEDSSGDQTWNRATTFRKGNKGPVALSKGDLVECRMFRDRRTKDLVAREIRLLQSEKERARLEAEKEMLSNATLEHGVITSLKGEYGFLRSNKRREEVFFHYSNIHVDEEGAEKEGNEDLVLKEGQDMQFLVVSEHDGDLPSVPPPAAMKRRISARQVKLQPRGSVQFHEHVAEGVVGRIVVPPQPVDSTHNLESHGRIHILEPLTIKDEEGNEKVLEEVFLSAKDSPGGSFSFRGGSSVGMWVQEGDKLLFDLVKDFVDGSCHAKPTRYLKPNPKPLELLMGATEYPDLALSDEEDAAVRLIDVHYAMRADGIVNAVRDTYGFLHFSERPVDVHFKLFQVLPEELQVDLRRNLGYPNPEKPLRLQVGAEASFDLSVHGTIHTGPPSSGNRTRNRQNNDRENLKAQRILFLPKGSVRMSVTLATGVEAVVAKEDAKQAYSGTIELDSPVQPMSIIDRHPFVAKAVDDFLNNDEITTLDFHDVQTQKEDDVYIEIMDLKAEGKVTYTYLPQPGETEHKGRLCFTKVDPADIPTENGNVPEVAEVADEGSNDEENTAKKPAKKKGGKDKATKSLHFDKGSLSSELKKNAPPAVGDKVKFDIVQSRKTGVIAISNMTMVSRHTPEIAEASAEGMGIVTEVVPKRKFGFISLQDEEATKRELLFFHLSSFSSGEGGGGKNGGNVRKGDEVKFNIGTEKNGKRVALNVTLLPKGSVPSKADKNACNGLVLLVPSHTTLKNTPLRHASSNTSNVSSTSQSSRWDKSGDTETPSEDRFAGQGCILLTSDPAGMFASMSESNGSSHSKESTSPKEEDVQLRYKNGGLALQGSGASSLDDKSQPKRGDLVSFVKGKNGKGLRDIRVVKRGAATLLRGRLENIKLVDEPESESAKAGTAQFVAATPGEESYDVDLSKVVSCDLAVLKEKEPVEAIFHEGKLFGISRTVDLYLESKLGLSHRERPKLNLTVKKDRGGTIIAQSMMAKGPDGTVGFATGWTTRTSRYTTQPGEA